MMWGKLLGGAFGFMIGGPLGAVLGAALGHTFDRGLQLQLEHDGPAPEPMSPGDAERVRMSFFTATFAVLGHVAKADGRVAPSEIRLVEAVMTRMSLDAELRRAAIALFDQGKREDFELEPLVVQFREECARRSDLYRVFLEILIQGAYADGVMAPDEERVLRDVGRLLGFGDAAFAQLALLVRVGMGLGTGGAGAGTGDGGGTGRDRSRAAPSSGRMSLADAYRVLGVERRDDDATVKRAYRRLMSQHHPDKLVAKGLPEEMIRVATDKTQKIREAWERVRESRR